MRNYNIKKMTVDRKETITLPKWLLVVFLPLVISFAGSYTTIKIVQASTSKQVEVNTDEIKELRNNKADKDVLKLIYDQLKDINDKLDTHITNDKK